MDLHGARQYARGRRDLLLRRQHGRTRAARCAASTRSPRSVRRWPSRPSCSCSTTPRTTAPRRRCVARGEDIELIALAQRRGKAWARQRADAALAGRVLPAAQRGLGARAGATAALDDALDGDPRAACAVAALRAPRRAAAGLGLAVPDGRDGARRRAPARAAVVVSRAGALDQARRLGPVRRAARAPRRRRGRSAGWTPAFFVYSDEVDFQKRLARRRLALALRRRRRVAIHHEQLSTGALPARRIVEHARGRDRYMRKHHGPLAALAVRVLTAWTYALRALAALVAPRP